MGITIHNYFLIQETVNSSNKVVMDSSMVIIMDTSMVYNWSITAGNKIRTEVCQREYFTTVDCRAGGVPAGSRVVSVWCPCGDTPAPSSSTALSTSSINNNRRAADPAPTPRRYHCSGGRTRNSLSEVK